MTPPETLTAEVAAVCPITGVDPEGVIFPTASATPEQIASGEAVAAAFDFALETAKAERLTNWYAAKLAAGITIDGTTLACTEHDQNRFSALATALALGAKKSGLKDTDDCPTPIWDYAGASHSLKVNAAETLLANYFLAIAAIEAQYAVNEAALAACATVEAVDAANLG